jgi:hypothetical protein
VAFGPVIGSLPDGVILNVAPVASADRRYVRMTMQPQFFAAQGFDTFTVPAAVGGGPGGFLPGGFGGVGGMGQGLGGGWHSPYGGMPWGGGPAYAAGYPEYVPPQTVNGLVPLGNALRRSTQRGRSR